MARALVFVHYPGGLEEARAFLSSIQSDLDVIGRTGVVVESVQFVFGAAHFLVTLCGPSWADIDQGILTLQGGLNSVFQGGQSKPGISIGPSSAVCSTTTVLGVNLAEAKIEAALESGKLFSEMRTNLAKQGGCDPNNQQIVAAVSLMHFVRDRIEHLLKLCESASSKGLPGGFGGITTALREVQSRLT